MCDTESNSLLSTSTHLASMQSAGGPQQHQLLQQPSPPYDLNAMNIVNAVPAVATTSTSIHHNNGLTATSPQPPPPLLPAISAKLFDDIAAENYWLREKMKEITADRDRLLCEVANLRLELDMAELKRLPEDRLVLFFFSFPINFNKI